MHKICVVTTTRAEYGLLYWLMRSIREDPGFTLQLVVTGTHLSSDFGSTIDRIREDGFTVDRSFDMQLHGDQPMDITHSLSIALEGFGSAFTALAPDLIILPGDRFEVVGAALAANIASIPVAHLHGGELTFGAMDDAFRHAITKLSHLHFTATESYRKRVIQMGEDPRRVFHVGATGLDSINRLNLLSKSQLEEDTGFIFGLKNLLVTYHPETLSTSSPGRQIDTLTGALETFQDIHFIITYPNADPGHQEIINTLESFASNHPKRVLMVKSLGQLRYLSFMKWVDGVVGNSSSGIIEAPSLHTGTVNIGRRQEGRVRANSVIDCECEQSAIIKAIQKLFSPSFKNSLQEVKNPYGNGHSTEKIIRELKKTDLQKLRIKRFYDL
ncbi:MAG: UDP-N-acetylglucosamine 2-epimerase (hydrolyzing) [Bacteroidales bacterium]|nr:UDP-N-acetylglucosamine 2-epimerase (hydrolyzing) [Bacteroidales bacterium]